VQPVRRAEGDRGVPRAKARHRAAVHPLRACKAAYQKAWYEKNKDRHKANVAKIRRTRVRLHQQLVRAAKDVPCADCGRRFPPYVMDFDHRGAEKAGNIAEMVSTATTVALLAEIGKCDVVCANCHRERTFGRADSAWHRRRKPGRRRRAPT
jgi:hypothetical protein